MKVYITQGHEQGIGLEVLFKSMLLFSTDDLSHLRLIAFKESADKTLRTLKLPYQITDDSVSIAGSTLEAEWLEDITNSQSLTALTRGMELCGKSDILFTLPTSKDQLGGHAGHTELFRSHFKNQDLIMFFSSPDLRILLLTDHVAIKELSDLITEDLIYRRTLLALNALQETNWRIEHIFIAGLNPHAGEKGIIGSEDSRITNATKRINSEKNLNISGPYPADTMLLEKKSKHDIFIFLFHDQGLGVFKSLQGFIGSNITLGMPFLRFSPDHGTSFSLYGKNCADYRGCFYSLKEALTILRKGGNGKDSNH